MESLFNMDNKFVKAVDKIIALIQLNLIWLLLCIPIVTIGASSCALYKVAEDIAHDREGYIFRDFMRIFKKNFKINTKIWLLELAIAGVITVDFLFWNAVNSSYSLYMKCTVIILSSIYIMSLFYIFPLTIYMKSSVKKIIKNGFILMIKYLHKSILMLMCMVAVVFSTLISTYAACIFMMMGASGLAAFNSIIIMKIINNEIDNKNK